MVDPKVVQEHHNAVQKRRRIETLFMRLVLTIVGMTVIYLLFNIALGSS